MNRKAKLNKLRAKKIEKLLGLEETDFNNKNKYVRVADVLCDVRHYCDLKKINLVDEQVLADIYYEEER